MARSHKKAMPHHQKSTRSVTYSLFVLQNRYHGRFFGYPAKPTSIAVIQSISFGNTGAFCKATGHELGSELRLGLWYVPASRESRSL